MCSRESVVRREPVRVKENLLLRLESSPGTASLTQIDIHVTALMDSPAPKKQTTTSARNIRVAPSQPTRTPVAGPVQPDRLMMRPYIYSSVEEDQLVLDFRRRVQQLVFGGEDVDWRSIPAVVDEVNEHQANDDVVDDEMREALELWSLHQNLA